MLKNIRTYILFFLCFGPYLLHAQYYQGSNIEFGQNRVQYNSFFWQSLNFEEFKVHFYQGGKDFAVFAAKSAHKNKQQLERLLDFHTLDKLELIVFNSQSHFRQSNIGLGMENTATIGGVTRIIGNRVFIYYEGDHISFDRQIRSVLSEVLVSQMMYGVNWKEVVKNSTLLNLPEWYTQGLYAYLGTGWNPLLEVQIKSVIQGKNYKYFNRLRGKEAEYAGHALWNYIAETYGENSIANILYMTRIAKNIDNGFLYVVGSSLRQLILDSHAYYDRRFKSDEFGRDTVALEPWKVRTKKIRKYSQFKVSPDQRYHVLVSNELGQYKVWLYDTEEDSRKRMLKGGHKLDRIPDYTYPLVAWHPKGIAFCVLEEKKGEIVLSIINMDDRKKTVKRIVGVEKILSIDYAPNGKEIVFSGVKKGKTDLFIYKIIGGNKVQLTDDFYDDLEPRYLDDGRIIFSSNRPDDTLRKQEMVNLMGTEMDLFTYNLKDQRGQKLTQLTNTPSINETTPAPYLNDGYTFLSDKNGILNRYRARYDSAISYVDTAVHYRYFSVTDPLSNFGNSILEYDINPKAGHYSMLFFDQNEYKFFVGQIADDSAQLPSNVQESTLRANQLQQIATDELIKGGALEGVDKIGNVQAESIGDSVTEDGFDLGNYQFADGQSVHEKQTITFDIDDENSDSSDDIGKNNADTFEMPRVEIYDVNYTTNEVATQLQVGFLTQNYQRYGEGDEFNNPGLGALLRVELIDLFEDYRISGGMRLPFQLGNSDFLLMYEDLKHRLDRRFLVSRSAISALNGTRWRKAIMYNFKARYSYPFSEVASLRTTGLVRNDNIVTKAMDASSLRAGNELHHMLGLKMEYVYDNTRPIALNLLNGTRLKIWAEYMQEVRSQNIESASEIFKKGDFTVLGFDVRHYQKVHRDIVWTTRFATSTSVGSQKLLYYLGGVDGWVAAKFDPSIIVDQNQGYAYQTIATPMRGFYQNRRNGNSFAIVNTEIRFPVFSYFRKDPIKSDFVKNFQVIGFGDAGTAWTGLNPYALENSFNTTEHYQKPLLITIENQREPIVFGYGFGLRSRLFGYFMRLDWAWGVDDGRTLPSIIHFSLSLDF